MFFNSWWIGLVSFCHGRRIAHIHVSRHSGSSSPTFSPSSLHFALVSCPFPLVLTPLYSSSSPPLLYCCLWFLPLLLPFFSPSNIHLFRLPPSHPFFFLYFLRLIPTFSISSAHVLWFVILTLSLFAQTRSRFDFSQISIFHTRLCLILPHVPRANIPYSRFSCSHRVTHICHGSLCPTTTSTTHTGISHPSFPHRGYCNVLRGRTKFLSLFFPYFPPQLLIRSLHSATKCLRASISTVGEECVCVEK